jgi:hypothetical protein
MTESHKEMIKHLKEFVKSKKETEKHRKMNYNRKC